MVQPLQALPTCKHKKPLTLGLALVPCALKCQSSGRGLGHWGHKAIKAGQAPTCNNNDGDQGWHLWGFQILRTWQPPLHCPRAMSMEWTYVLPDSTCDAGSIWPQGFCLEIGIRKWKLHLCRDWPWQQGSLKDSVFLSLRWMLHSPASRGWGVLLGFTDLRCTNCSEHSVSSCCPQFTSRRLMDRHGVLTPRAQEKEKARSNLRFIYLWKGECEWNVTTAIPSEESPYFT